MEMEKMIELIDAVSEDWAARLQAVLGRVVHAKDSVQARVRRDRKERHQ